LSVTNDGAFSLLTKCRIGAALALKSVRAWRIQNSLVCLQLRDALALSGWIAIGVVIRHIIRRDRIRLAPLL
jgi:energy-converting hydrogenase Eha subunit E